jgi:hypothetical protein
MQVVQAGSHKMLYLELEKEIIEQILRQLGFEFRIIEDGRRTMTLEVRANGRESPLLLFDAADPGNLGWFSRCQFYVDGRTSSVLQTPISIANLRDRGGRVQRNALRVQIAKELPANFRLPGKQTVSEQVVYAIFFNFMSALLQGGVAVCGGPVVRPLAGRGDGLGPRS